MTTEIIFDLFPPFHRFLKTHPSKSVVIVQLFLGRNDLGITSCHSPTSTITVLYSMQ